MLRLVVLGTLLSACTVAPAPSGPVRCDGHGIGHVPAGISVTFNGCDDRRLREYVCPSADTASGCECREHDSASDEGRVWSPPSAEAFGADPSPDPVFGDSTGYRERLRSTAMTACGWQLDFSPPPAR